MFQCDPFESKGKQKLNEHKQPFAIVVEVAAGFDEVVVVTVVGLVVIELLAADEKMADSDVEIGAEEVAEVDAPVVWVLGG